MLAPGAGDFSPPWNCNRLHILLWLTCYAIPVSDSKHFLWRAKAEWYTACYLFNVNNAH